MYATIVIKLVIGMLGVLIFLRFTGKTQMANMTPLDSVNTIILGALVGSILYMPDTSVWIMVFSIAIWTVINMLIRWLLRINFFNKLIHGESEFVIREGRLDLKMMKKNNLGIDQLRTKLREHDIYSLMDVDEVRFETDGKFTIFKHTEHSPSYLLVNNGEVIKENLEEIEKDEEWLKTELDKLDFSDIKDIYCAEYTPQKGFYIISMDGEIMNKAESRKKKRQVEQ